MLRPAFRLRLLPLVLALSCLGTSAAVAQDEAGFQRFLETLRPVARERGISQRTIDAVLPTLTLSQRVVELDRAQPGGTSGTSAIPPFAPYQARHVDAERIGGGRRVYGMQRARLAQVERETGVPGKILIAIWGHETNYGGYTGNFDLPRALATLAYEGRRRTLFTDEFLATLEMIDRGVPRARLQGSWAGATGNPQFLPSVYLRLARDGDGDGRADIWNSEADTLASIANYLVNAGWRAGQPWGIPVRVPTGYREQGNLLESPRCERVHERHSRWRTMAEWRRLGMVAQGAAWPGDDVLATLLEPDGRGDTAYLLTGNYRVILDYNCSNFYALSVGLLADAVAR